jgi:hypothetical protein
MRRNRTPFYPLNYTGMIPGQKGPHDQGLLLTFVAIRFSKAPGDQVPRTAKRVPLGRVTSSIPKLDHL